MVRRHGEGYDWRKEPIDGQAVYASGGGKAHRRYSMFNGMIDSREVIPQRGSSSQSLGGSSIRQRRTTSEMEIERLHQELQKRDAFLKAQEEYQRQQQAHQEYVNAQQMAVIQAMYQMHGQTFVMPEIRPPPTSPQWGMYAQMPSLAAQGSGFHASDPYQTLSPGLGNLEMSNLDTTPIL